MTPQHGVIEIAGAGPAGLSAALTLQRHGAHPRVYERRTSAGARFHGDLQGLENWSTARDVLDELAAMGIAPDFDPIPCYEVLLYDPDGRESLCRAQRPIFYLLRRGVSAGTLDHSLMQQALAAGVELRPGQALAAPSGAAIVCGGPRTANIIATGYLFETDMADGVFAVVGEALAPQGYAYLLVHRGQATLSVCLFAAFHDQGRYRRRALEFFRERLGFTMRNVRRFGGAGGYRYPASARDGEVLYAGEAAGFQDALFGFGIRLALRSGHLAALSLLQGRPADYDRLWRREFGRRLRTGLVNRFFYARCGDAGYRWLVRHAAAVDTRDWLRGFYRGSCLKAMLFPLLRPWLAPERRRGAGNRCR